jgi:syntaxin-binding protein 1
VARLFESVETDFVAKLLAFMIQSDLEDHKKLNQDFGVSADPSRVSARCDTD